MTSLALSTSRVLSVTSQANSPRVVFPTVLLLKRIDGQGFLAVLGLDDNMEEFFGTGGASEVTLRTDGQPMVSFQWEEPAARAAGGGLSELNAPDRFPGHCRSIACPAGINAVQQTAGGGPGDAIPVKVRQRRRLPAGLPKANVAVVACDGQSVGLRRPCKSSNLSVSYHE